MRLITTKQQKEALKLIDDCMETMTHGDQYKTAETFEKLSDLICIIGGTTELIKRVGVD